MARERMVTRSIDVVTATALCVNTQTDEIVKITVSVNTTLSDKKLANKVKELVDNDELAFVRIVDAVESQKLYGMKEIDFISNAQVLSDEGRKSKDDDTENAVNVEA